MDFLQMKHLKCFIIGFVLVLIGAAAIAVIDVIRFLYWVAVGTAPKTLAVLLLCALCYVVGYFVLLYRGEI